MCQGVSCQTRDSLELFKYFKEEIIRRGLEEYIKLIPNGCFGMCPKGPAMIVLHEILGPIRYIGIKNNSDIDRIIEKTLIDGEIVEDFYIEKYLRED